MIPLTDQHSSTCFIEYNSYMFGTRTKSRVRVQPIMDSSGRIEIARRFILTVDTLVVPRRNIPGGGVNGIQLNAPGPKIPAPGINPFHLLATTDSEVEVIIRKLSESGKTLRYIGQGCSDLYVNTINANTGKFVQDLNYGPHCKIIDLQPRGFNKCWKVVWECEFTLQVCDTPISYNSPSSRILEYNYKVNYSYNKEGFCRRSITGVIKIVPPMLRYKTALPPTGAKESKITDFALYQEYSSKATTLVNAIVGERDLYKSAKFTTIVRQTSEILRQYIEQLQLESIEIDMLSVDAPGIEDIITDLLGVLLPDDVTALKDSYIALILALNSITADTTLKAEDLEKFYTFRNYIVSGATTKALKHRVLPELAGIFPEASTPVSSKLAFGPYPSDNIGNYQNYETVDQYRELVFNSIVIPFNFHRVHTNYDIEMNKSVMHFQIVDEEKPAFSFVPGYSSVDVNHSSHSSGAIFHRWNTNISARFTFGKFLYGSNKDRLNLSGKIEPVVGGHSEKYGFLPRLASDPIPTDLNDGKPFFRKVYPSRKQAYKDFLKIVMQRLSFAILFTGMDCQFTYKAGDGKREIKAKGISAIPHTLSIQEEVTGNSIQFSVGFTIMADLDSIWVATGHGTPCVIASDLNTANPTAAKFIDGVASLIDTKVTDPGVIATKKTLLSYVAGMLFSTYSDYLVHYEWLQSQKYASNNARGSSNLFLDRGYDRPINICVASATDIVRAIPMHGEYPLFPTPNGREIKPYEITSLSAADSKTDDPHKREETDSSTGGFTDKAPPISVGFTIPLTNPIYKGKEKSVGRWETVKNYAIYSAWKGAVFGPLGPLFLFNQDIDILYNELGLEYDPDELTTTSRSSIYVREMSDYLDNEDELPITSYDFGDDFIVDQLQDFLTPPTADNSWLQYESLLEVVTDSKVIRHKILPEETVRGEWLSSNPNHEGLLNILYPHFEQTENLGGAVLKGGYLTSDIEANYKYDTLKEDVTEDEVIQVINTPTNIVRLKGFAYRYNFDVVAPALILYGGRIAYQRKRRFIHGLVSKNIYNIYYGAWEIEYIIKDGPQTILRPPENALFRSEYFTENLVETDQILDIIGIPDEYEV